MFRIFIIFINYLLSANNLLAATMKKKVFLKRIFHREKWRIFLFFDYDEEINSLIRTLDDCKYSGTHHSWYVDDNEETLRKVLRHFSDVVDVDISSISLKNKPDDIHVDE
jgi:hypothetical protein